LRGSKVIKMSQILITEATSGGQITMLLILCQGNKGTETGMIRKFKPPFKTTLLLMRKGKKRSMTLKFIVLETPPHFPHLTQSAYEESLMNNQINDLSKGEKSISSPNKYNLRSKKKEGK
jgi:hypothetical protein